MKLLHLFHQILVFYRENQWKILGFPHSKIINVEDIFNEIEDFKTEVVERIVDI